jgi:uncharacterized protein YdeI (YjbR/CyaY-like superfamily)
VAAALHPTPPAQPVVQAQRPGLLPDAQPRHQYGIVWRLQTPGKPETRARRLRAFLDMLSRGKKLH